MRIGRPETILLFFMLFSPSLGQGAASDYVRAFGRDLVQGPARQGVCLRGVNFNTDLLYDSTGTNQDWLRNSANDAWIPITDWYGESDVSSIKGFGFSVLRLQLNYRLFEDDATPCTCDLSGGANGCDFFNGPPGDSCNYTNSVWSQIGAYNSGWEYLDTWILWAKTNNIYLILDMHVPPGGLQLSPEGAFLWTDSAKQERLKRLWRAIAKRYVGEPIIAAFDILNEPAPAEATPTLATADAWQTLANAIITEIRKEDPYHLIIVEKVIAITNDTLSVFAYDEYTMPMANAWKKVNDQNVMYDFHFYWPMINHQGNWGLCGGGNEYPRSDISEETFLNQSNRNCDKQGGAGHFSDFSQFSIDNTTPLIVTEWGGALTGGGIFDHLGGPAYLADMLDIFDTGQVHSVFYYTNLLHQQSDQNLPFDNVRTGIFSTFFASHPCDTSPRSAPPIGAWSLLLGP